MKKNPKIEAVKGLVAALLTLLVTVGAIDGRLSAAVGAVIASGLTLFAAFAVRPPKRKRAQDLPVTKYGGSE